MAIPLHITFKDVEHSDAVEARIRKEAKHLERFAKRITSCSVVFGEPHKRRNQGNLFSVHIELLLPGGHKVSVGGGKDEDHAHEDPYVAVRDAFKTAGRVLQDEVRKMRGAVKLHKARAAELGGE